MLLLIASSEIWLSWSMFEPMLPTGFIFLFNDCHASTEWIKAWEWIVFSTTVDPKLAHGKFFSFSVLNSACSTIRESLNTFLKAFRLIVSFLRLGGICFRDSKLISWKIIIIMWVSLMEVNAKKNQSDSTWIAFWSSYQGWLKQTKTYFRVITGKVHYLDRTKEPCCSKICCHVIVLKAKSTPNLVFIPWLLKLL